MDLTRDRRRSFVDAVVAQRRRLIAAVHRAPPSRRDPAPRTPSRTGAGDATAATRSR